MVIISIVPLFSCLIFTCCVLNFGLWRCPWCWLALCCTTELISLLIVLHHIQVHILVCYKLGRKVCFVLFRMRRAKHILLFSFWVCLCVYYYYDIVVKFDYIMCLSWLLLMRHCSSCWPPHTEQNSFESGKDINRNPLFKMHRWVTVYCLRHFPTSRWPQQISFRVLTSLNG